MQKSVKGSVTLIGISGVVEYCLRPSATLIKVNTNGELSTKTISCTAYKKMSDGDENCTSDEVTIFYTYTKDGTESDQISYEYGSDINVDSSYDLYTFYLYKGVISSSYGFTYENKCDISIIRDGLLDVSFIVWRGTESNPNNLTYQPWTGLNDGQTDSDHIGDYYIGGSDVDALIYWQYTATTTEMGWEKVSDAVLENVKNAITRSNNTGWYVWEEENSCEEFFQTHTYVIGDLLSYMPSDGFSEMYMAIENESSSGFDWNDWILAQNLKGQLEYAGLDISSNDITITADRLKLRTTSGETTADINMFVKDEETGEESSGLYLNTKLLKIDGDVTIDGSTSTINGWYIDDSKIYTIAKRIPSTVSGGALRKVYGTGVGNDYLHYAFWAGEDIGFTESGSTSSELPFSVTLNGHLTATGATINGDIVATSLSLDSSVQIPITNIDSDSLKALLNEWGYTNSGETIITTSSFTTTKKYYDKDGVEVSSDSDSVVYYIETVKLAGKDEAISETIVPLKERTIITNIGVGTLNNEDTSYNNTSDTHYFAVSKDGLLTAQNALIQGTVYSNAGQIGGCTISDNGISSNNGNWSLNKDGSLTAQNATINGTINAQNGIYLPTYKYVFSTQTVLKLDKVYDTVLLTNTFVWPDSTTFTSIFKLPTYQYDTQPLSEGTTMRVIITGNRGNTYSTHTLYWGCDDDLIVYVSQLNWGSGSSKYKYCSNSKGVQGSDKIKTFAYSSLNESNPSYYEFTYVGSNTWYMRCYDGNLKTN